MHGSPLVLSLLVTLLASAFILPLGTLTGLWLARHRGPGQVLLETGLMLPLVLPPTVVGYYLLRLLGHGSPLQRWLGMDLLFTPWAAVTAATVVGLPLMIQAARAAFAAIDRRLEDAARTLGASEWRVFFRVTLPLARTGLLAGWILGTTRALGEFGATLMVAGNIPGRTQTLPLAIYEAVMNQDFASANRMVLLLTALAFFSLWSVRHLERRRPDRTGGRT